MADHVGGVTLALGIVSALLCRERTGVGQEVHTSLLAGMLAAQSWELTHYMMTEEMPPKAGRGHTHLFWQWSAYKTKDGWMALGGVDPSRWSRFCEAIERPDLATDERWSNAGTRIKERAELNALLDEHLSTRTTAEWMPVLEAADVFCAPVLGYDEVPGHPQVTENGYVVEMEHRKTGRTRVISAPLEFSATPMDSTGTEPMLGEHSDAVLADFGFTEAEIADLRRIGAV